MYHSIIFIAQAPIHPARIAWTMYYTWLAFSWCPFHFLVLTLPLRFMYASLNCILLQRSFVLFFIFTFLETESYKKEEKNRDQIRPKLCLGFKPSTNTIQWICHKTRTMTAFIISSLLYLVGYDACRWLWPSYLLISQPKRGKNYISGNFLIPGPKE